MIPPVERNTAPILNGPVHQEWRVDDGHIGDVEVAVVTMMSTNCTMQVPLDRDGAHALIAALEKRFPRLTIAREVPDLQGAHP